jgi:hypothetical protein
MVVHTIIKPLSDCANSFSIPFIPISSSHLFWLRTFSFNRLIQVLTVKDILHFGFPYLPVVVCQFDHGATTFHLNLQKHAQKKLEALISLDGVLLKINVK